MINIKQVYSLARKARLLKNRFTPSYTNENNEIKLEDNQDEDIMDIGELNQEDIQFQSPQIIDDEENYELIEQKEEIDNFNKEDIQFIQSQLLYKGDDPYDEKIVTRPQKGLVWGLGGQLIQQKQNYFKKGRWPTLDETIYFLELEMAKDIVLVDFKEMGRTNIERYGIIVSCFSAKHCYKTAKNLLKALEKVEVPSREWDPCPPKIAGRKDDEWVMLRFNEIQIHFFTELHRQEIDLEDKWKNPVSEDEVEEFEKIQKYMKKKTIFEPLVE